MNDHSHNDGLRKLGRCVIFCFVTTPAMMLFAVFVYMSLGKSIAGTYLDTARQLVANAPADKVWVGKCIRPEASSPAGLGVPNTLDSRNVKFRCYPVLKNASDLQRSLDAIIRNAYLISVIIGYMTWVAKGEGYGVSFEWLKKRVKP